MSLKGVALTAYLLSVGMLLLYSDTSVVMGLGVVLIALAAVAVVTALSRQHVTDDRRADPEPPSFESNN